VVKVKLYTVLFQKIPIGLEFLLVCIEALSKITISGLRIVLIMAIKKAKKNNPG